MFKKLLLSICLFVMGLSCLLPINFSMKEGDKYIVMATGDESLEGEGEQTPPAEDTPTDEPTAEEQEIINKYESGYTIRPSTHITDNNLYSKLLKLVKDDIKAKYNIAYNGDLIYSDMFKEFTEIIIDDNIIETLEGIELIKFDNLKTLQISRNKLTSISVETFENMPVIETLDFTANNLSSVNLGKLPTLTTLNLAKNSLSALDLSDLGASNLRINVAQNKFVDISKIKFPERINSISLNIINNSIANIPEEYFELNKLSMDIGIQGIGEGSDIISDTVTPIRYYKTNNQDLKLNIYKYNGVLDELKYTISDEDIPENSYYIDKLLPIGKYIFEYVLGESPAYDKTDITRVFYEAGKMTVLPATCNIKYEFKGEVTDTFNKKVTGKVKVMLSTVEGATIMYKINSGEWIDGGKTSCEFMCDEGGNYTIYTKVIIDGMESKVKSVLVRTSQNVIIPDIVMLVLVLLFTLALFMIVVPLISRKFFRK